MGPIATRRERVVLELDDQFTAGILRAAAATKLADKAMDDFGGTNTRTTRSGDASSNSVNKQARSLNDLDLNARRAERGSSLLLDSLIGFGPALLPIGAVAIPAVAGLSAELGFAAAAGGTAILAFHGMGDALKSLDAYQLQPSTANLEKLDQAMSKLGPDAQKFVHELDALEPRLKSIKRAAEGGLLPGVGQGIDSLLTRLPQVRAIVAQVAKTSGNLVADAGDSLAGRDYDQFFNYLQHNAQPILSDLGRTVGNLTLSMANLFVATAPEQRQFSSWLLEISRDFARFTDGLPENNTFIDLMDYVHKSGPEVAHAFSSIADATVQVAQAAAPLGGPTLRILSTVADVIGKIADSPIGTPLVTLASGLALINRALSVNALAKNSLIADLLYGKLDAKTGARGPAALTRTSTGLQNLGGRVRDVRKDVTTLGTTWATVGARSEREVARVNAAQKRLGGNLGGVAKGGLAAAGTVAVMSGLTDELHLTNTATLALAGSFVAPGIGTAAGAIVGGMLDLKDASEGFAKGLDTLHAAVGRGDFKLAAAQAKALNAELKDLNNQSGFGDALSDASKRASGTLFGDLQGAHGSLMSKGDTIGKALTLNFGGLLNGDVKSPGLAAGLDKISTAKAQREMTALTSRAILAGRGLNVTAAGARALSASTEQMARSLQKARNALTKEASIDAYKASLDDLRASLKENGRTLDANTNKGRANRAALRNIASSALDASETLRGVGKVRFLDGARDQFIKAAIAAGMTRKQARALAEEFGLLDTLHPKVKVTVDGVLTAKANVAQLINALTGLHDKTIRINTVTTNSKTPMAAGYADGGFVSGPGGPREDKVRALLSNGEFVVNASATQRFRRELEWMNARRYANGGAVGRVTASLQPMTLPAIAVSVGTDLNGHITATAEYVVDRTLAGRDSMTTAASVAAGPSIPGGWD